jgi:hypothetical protein
LYELGYVESVSTPMTTQDQHELNKKHDTH